MTRALVLWLVLGALWLGGLAGGDAYAAEVAEDEIAELPGLVGSGYRRGQAVAWTGVGMLGASAVMGTVWALGPNRSNGFQTQVGGTALALAGLSPILAASGAFGARQALVRRGTWVSPAFSIGALATYGTWVGVVVGAGLFGGSYQAASAGFLGLPVSVAVTMLAAGQIAANGRGLRGAMRTVRVMPTWKPDHTGLVVVGRF